MSGKSWVRFIDTIWKVLKDIRSYLLNWNSTITIRNIIPLPSFCRLIKCRKEVPRLSREAGKYFDLVIFWQQFLLKESYAEKETESLTSAKVFFSPFSIHFLGEIVNFISSLFEKGNFKKLKRLVSQLLIRKFANYQTLQITIIAAKTKTNNWTFHRHIK